MRAQITFCLALS